MCLNSLRLGRFAFACVLGVAVAAAAARAAEKAEIEVTSDLVYATVDGEELKLDLAAPKGLDHAVPAIVMIHGGGWSGGNRKDMAGLMKQAAERGYVSATISYRLTPKHRFPAQIEDVKAAIRYLRANADKLHIDPEHIGALGGSAGAHLAMMLGTLDSGDGLEGNGGNPDQSSKVQVVVNIVGPVNLVMDSYTDVQEQILEAFVGGKPKDEVEECRRASPITYVSSGDAPTLSFYGTKDPLIPLDQGLQWAAAMTKAGVPGRVELLQGAGHAWGGSDMERTLEESMEFFDRHLKR